MNLNINRAVDPTRLSVSLDVTAADIEQAFGAQADPDEQLFYDLFGPDLREMPVSVALGRFAALAQKVEQKATTLDGTLGIEPRGT